MIVRTSQLPKAKLVELMAYADGELDPHERAALEAELARSPEAVSVLESFRTMGDHLRSNHAVTPDLTGAIMGRLAHERPAPVLDLHAARARKVKLGAAVASFAAMAAAVSIYLGTHASSLAPQMATSALGVEVHQVDENAKVFSIPALHSNASSVVVWLGDEDDAQQKLPDAAPSLQAAPR